MELLDVPHQSLQRLATENPANFFLSLVDDGFGSLESRRGVASIDECAELCQSDPPCMSFSFTPYDNALCVLFPDSIDDTADELIVPMPIQSGNMICTLTLKCFSRRDAFSIVLNYEGA